MKYIFVFTILLSSLYGFSQDSVSMNINSASYQVGNGIDLSLNNGDYQFNLGGMIQPYAGYVQDTFEDAEYFFNSKRTYFHISGKAAKEKVEFLLQTDFSLGSPLLDAWLSYSPHKSTTITFGQKQTIANNREMMVMEDQLQLIDRGLLSQTFSASGREFGFFVNTNIKLGPIMIVPQIAITSGDGRNSFGADSRDVDLGGLKYAARLDLLPFGAFSPGNDGLIADIKRETKPKILLGAAASFNDGASNSVGEGHNNLVLYNELGQAQLPDYRQVYADALLKFKGISLLGEYVISTATNLSGAFLDNAAANPLLPTQISELLALGSATNIQLGYVSKWGYAIDYRYSIVKPEFDSNPNSIVQPLSSNSVALSKYINENNLKMSAVWRYLNDGAQTIQNVGFMVQVRF